MLFRKSVVFTALCSALSCIPNSSSAESLFFDNDSKADLALYQAGSHLISSSGGALEARACGLSRDFPTPGNFLSKSQGELASFSPSFGVWSICSSTTIKRINWGATGDRPVSGDFNGDGLSDYAVFRPATADWLIRLNRSDGKAGASEILHFGETGDQPLVANFDTDNLSDLAVVRPLPDKKKLRWLVRRTGAKDLNLTFGLIGDIPVVADYNGDGKEDIAVWRPWTGQWFLKKEKKTQQWGLPGDIPAPADYDGDKKSDFIVYRPAVNAWYVLTRKGKTFVIPQGGFASRVANDSRSASLARRVVNDFNGDGLSDYVVLRRTAAGTIQFLMNSGTAFAHPTPSVEFGLAGDTVIRGDFDGDHVSDIAVARLLQGIWNWYFLRSSDIATGGPVRQFPFGLAGDEIKPADYDGDGVTDVAVVRAMPNNTKVWLINYSSGQKSEPIVWGKAADKTSSADLDGDGLSDFITIRQRDTQLLWNFRLADGSTRESKLYGFVGDIPVVGDFDGDGKAEIAVIRESNGFYVIFIDGKDPFIWGLKGDAPLIGQFDGTGAFNNAVWRVISGQGFFFVHTLYGFERVVPFGVSGDLVMQSSITDTSSLGTTASNTNAGTGSPATPTTGGSGTRLNCASRTNASAVGGGFIWKPVSESNSKLAVLFPSSTASNISKAALVESRSDGDVVMETLRFSGNTNGNRPTFRGSRPGRDYPNGVILVRQDTGNRNHCIVVDNPGRRYD